MDGGLLPVADGGVCAAQVDVGARESGAVHGGAVLKLAVQPRQRDELLPQMYLLLPASLLQAFTTTIRWQNVSGAG